MNHVLIHPLYVDGAIPALTARSASPPGSKPSWYLVTTDDRMIPPSLQRDMSKRAGSTVVETPGSHSIYVSQPGVVADLVERAASDVGSPAMA